MPGLPHLCDTSFVKSRGPLILGVLIGMVFMVLLSEGYHASAQPVCVACHSMNDVGRTWQMSNHKQFDAWIATCPLPT